MKKISCILLVLVAAITALGQSRPQQKIGYPQGYQMPSLTLDSLLTLPYVPYSAATSDTVLYKDGNGVIRRIKLAASGGGSGGADRLSARTYYTSKVLGTTGGADLRKYSRVFGTKYTTQLQQLLDTVPDYSHIIFDGRYAVDSLVIPSNRHLTFPLGCGLLQADNSNNQLLQSRSRQSAAITDSNIVIDGYGVLNANGWDSSNTVRRQTRLDPGGNFVNALRFLGIKNLNVSQITIRNAQTYAVLVDRWQNVEFGHVVVDNDQLINCDGIDLCGKGDNGYIHDCDIAAHDDKIAIASNGDASENPYCAAGFGTITNVRLVNNYFRGGTCGVGLYHGGGDSIINLVCDGLTGYTKYYWLRSFPFGGGLGCAKNLTFRNINVDVTTESNVAAPYQGLAVVVGNAFDLHFENIKGSVTGGFNDHFVLVGGYIDNLYLDGYYAKIIEDRATKNIINNGSTIGNLFTTNIDDSRYYGYQTVFLRNGGYINNWTGSNVHLHNYLRGYYQSSAGGMGTARLTGVTFTGHNLTGTPIFFENGATPAVSQFTLSNYNGVYPASTGTITSKRGDGFDTSAATPTTVALDYTGSAGVSNYAGWNWVYSGGSAVYGNLGKSNVGIPSGQDGRIFSTFDGTAGGFNHGLYTSNTAVGYAFFTVGYTFTIGGDVYWIEGGGAGLMSEKVYVGEQLGVHRTAAGVYTIEKSADGGRTWTTLTGHSFTYNSTAKQWDVMDMGGTTYSGLIVNPRGQNVAP